MQHVHIEFQRVQTWLFSVPRLRAMVGANSIFGETLRVELPKLARQQDAPWKLRSLRSYTDYPTADPQDPLACHDDPALDARDGILSRDGGHFEAHFEKGAQAFAETAKQLIQERLPGLRFCIIIDGKELQKSQAHLSTELPVLAPCEWTGHGLASALIKQGDEHSAVSLNVERMHQAAKRSESGKASDLASLLIEATQLKSLQRPQDLNQLAGKGYLALIQADGNGVGKASRKYNSDIDRVSFFHRNRVLLRRALKKTIDSYSPTQGQAPLVPLMLGGDDLLLVCRAEIALPFVVKLCEELEQIQPSTSDFKLTLGVGVVIAKPTIPIYRLHEVLEQLVSSAKRRFRSLVKISARSVVDWAVYTTAWADDPSEFRHREWLCGTDQQLRVLSQRPLDVLGTGLDTLQGLLASAAKLRNAPRSQLRYLVEQLFRGCTLSELAFKELSAQARSALEQAGVGAPWRTSQCGSALLTEVLDLVEVLEIPRLGT